MSWSFSGNNPDLEKKFKALFIVARDSRKIFRLFKSLNEFQLLTKKYEDLIWQPKKAPAIAECLSRLGFFFYWIFDNLQILSNIKFINADPQFHLKLASWGWFLGLVFGLIKNLMDLNDLLNEKQKQSNQDNDEKKKDSKLDFLILKTLVEISGKLGDMVVAANGAGIAQKIFGKGFSEGTVAIGGLWSALVALWNHYLK